MWNFIDDHSGLFMILIICFVIILFVFVLPVTFNHIDAYGHIAAIEQLRKDSLLVDAQSNEDIMGQVTSWNQKIVATQRFNRMPFVCLYIPNVWDDVELIEIGQLEKFDENS